MRPLDGSRARLTMFQVTVLAVPHSTHGSDIFAVLSKLDGQHPHDIEAHVERTFGKHYTLSSVLTLQDIGLEEFPVNQTYKVIKPDVQKAVIRYLCSRLAKEDTRL